MSDYNFSFDSLKVKLRERYFLSEEVQFPNIEEINKGKASSSIVKISCDILKFFSLFLLSGKYNYITFDNLLIEGGDFENFLTEESQSYLTSNDPNIQEEFNQLFRVNIIEVYRKIFPLLKFLIVDIEEQYNLELSQKIVRATAVYDASELERTVYGYYSFFILCLNITRLEHFHYRSNDEIMKEILTLDKRADINKIDDEELVSFFQNKCRFLLKKVLFRLKCEGSNKKNIEMKYSFEMESDKPLTLENIELPTEFNNWINLIEGHYQINIDHKNLQKKRAKIIYKKTAKNNDIVEELPDFHGLAKIYKDHVGNLHGLKELINYLEKKKYDDSILFFEYANTVTHSYVFNNKISLECKQKDASFSYNTIFNSIDSFQKKYFIYNYFPWKKLADTISHELNNLADNLANEDDFKSFKLLSDLLNETLGKLKDSIAWSNQKNYIPVQFEFNDCQSAYQYDYKDFNKKVPLFFLSSFILPLDYELIQSDFENLYKDKLKFQTLQTVYGKLQKLVDNVQDAAENVKKQERRSIEILAVFSAIALFSIGSINVLSTETLQDKPNLIIQIIIGFGFSLSLFVLLIWLITRENIHKTHWIHWLAFLGFIIGAAYIFNYFFL